MRNFYKETKDYLPGNQDSPNSHGFCGGMDGCNEV